MAEKKKKQKRIKGTHYYTMQNMVKDLKKERKEIVKWQNAEAEKLDAYPDQINWLAGSIFDPMAEIVEGKVINAQVIARVPRDIFKQNQEKAAKLEELDDKLINYREDLAKQLDILPSMINLETGVINNKDYEGINPDEEEIKRKEAEAKEKKVAEAEEKKKKEAEKKEAEKGDKK